VNPIQRAVRDNSCPKGDFPRLLISHFDCQVKADRSLMFVSIHDYCNFRSCLYCDFRALSFSFPTAERHRRSDNIHICTAKSTSSYSKKRVKKTLSLPWPKSRRQSPEGHYLELTRFRVIVYYLSCRERMHHLRTLAPQFGKLRP
jgi:hypothetical protein